MPWNAWEYLLMVVWARSCQAHAPQFDPAARPRLHQHQHQHQQTTQLWPEDTETDYMRTRPLITLEITSERALQNCHCCSCSCCPPSCPLSSRGPLPRALPVSPTPCARVPCRLRGAALAGRVMTLNTKPGLLSMRMPGACLLLYSVHTTCTRQQGWPRVEWG